MSEPRHAAKIVHCLVPTFRDTIFHRPKCGYKNYEITEFELSKFKRFCENDRSHFSHYSGEIGRKNEYLHLLGIKPALLALSLKEMSSLSPAKVHFIEPMYALAVQHIPDGDDWLYEVKFDGYRSLVGRNKKAVTIWLRFR